MSKKIKVGIIFGGKSAEHEVSLQSAKNIVDAIDKNKYEVVLIGIDKAGKWHLNDAGSYLLHENNPKLISLNKSGNEVMLNPGSEDSQLTTASQADAIGGIDVIFPIIHGSIGEDGSLQGFLKMANLPFVGSGVMASSACMDKDITKRLLRDSGVPISDFLTFNKYSQENISFEETTAKLGLPLFIKPANMGSSIGVSKVRTEAEFYAAIKEAFKYDMKILVEEYIKGREIEVAVLGNQEPAASVPGEIIAQHDFYSYDAKYIDENGALLEAPAKLSETEVKQAQELAIKVFKTLGCEGLARVDFFLGENGKYYVNEVNTLPGFTKISMYPRLWSLSGINYTELIDRLLQLAIDRKEKENSLKTSYFD